MYEHRGHPRAHSPGFEGIHEEAEESIQTENMRRLGTGKRVRIAQTPQPASDQSEGEATEQKKQPGSVRVARLGIPRRLQEEAALRRSKSVPVIHQTSEARPNGIVSPPLRVPATTSKKPGTVRFALDDIEVRRPTGAATTLPSNFPPRLASLPRTTEAKPWVLRSDLSRRARPPRATPYQSRNPYTQPRAVSPAKLGVSPASDQLRRRPSLFLRLGGRGSHKKHARHEDIGKPDRTLTGDARVRRSKTSNAESTDQSRLQKLLTLLSSSRAVTASGVETSEDHFYKERTVPHEFSTRGRRTVKLPWKQLRRISVAKPDQEEDDGWV
jgi:hypothetical protein